MNVSLIYRKWIDDVRSNIKIVRLLNASLLLVWTVLLESIYVLKMATGNAYYDILLIGRTGKGKSTTGNKLLKIVENEEQPIPTTPEEDAKIPFFISHRGADSCTRYCKVLSTRSSIREAGKVRVLDTPGFASSQKTESDANVYEANLRIMRTIVRNQQEHGMELSRVLYFLPERGPLERADGTLREEIKIMHGYFGDVIFDIMVIIATNHSCYQKHGFTEEAMKATKDVFIKAFEEATGKHLPECPPILYLPLDKKDVLGKVKSAEVRSNKPLPLAFNKRCAKCAKKLVYIENVLVRVVKKEGSQNEEVPVDETKCHPCFIPKHGTLTKLAGGVAHVLTLGLPLVFEKLTHIETWPGFTNADEICPGCKRPPGSEACRKNKEVYKLESKKQEITTLHSTKIPKYGAYT